MARQFIREIEQSVNFYRDDRTGIAWIEDGRTGLGHSVHANISTTGSVRGMKEQGYWKKKDRVVRSHGWAYNIDTLVIDGELDKIVAAECRCQACIERRKR